MSTPSDDQRFHKYRTWFFAAAVYNLLWGMINVVFPNAMFDFLCIPRPTDTALWQVVGMFVLVYAPAYWWAGRHPYRFRHIIVIGLLGKVLGPIGFVWSAVAGTLPLAFGWINITNDVIWWPAFSLFLWEAAQFSGGLKNLLAGE